MTPADQWRQGLAQAIARHYTPHPRIPLILLVGSAARGLADAYSSLDFVIGWDGLVDLAWLTPMPLRPLAGERLALAGDDEGVWRETYQIGDLRLELDHTPLTAWANWSARLQRAHHTTPALQGRMDDFLHAQTLHGQSLYDAWRAQLAFYPEPLARRMVAEHLDFPPLWRLTEHGVAREDWFYFYTQLGIVTRHCLGVLAGLNRVYLNVTQVKRLSAILARLPLAPAHSAERLPGLWQQPPLAACEGAATYVMDVLELLEKEMPDLDTRRARALWE